MGGSWWFRVGVIVTSILVAIYVLLPTLLAGSAYERLASQAASLEGDQAAEEAAEGWRSWLPDTRINLGLDLQGGIDLTLDVEVHEAVLSTVAREVATVQALAEDEGIELAEVRRVRGEPMIEVALADEDALDDLRRLFSRRMGGYRYVGTREDGGRTWHRFGLTEERQAQIEEQAIEQALETLRNRIDETGVKEPSIVRKGQRINVQLPGIDNLEQAVEALGTAAVLEFFLVDEEFDPADLERAIQAAREQLDEETFNDDEALNDWLVETGRIPPDRRVLWQYEEGPDGKEIRSVPYVLKDEIILTGDDVNDASVQVNQYNQPYVALSFKPRGARIFAHVTGENVGKRFAIVLDRKVRSAPVIREKIAGGRASIEMGTGGYEETFREAGVLALVLRTGALPAPVTVGEVRTVGATLGADSIRAGAQACLVGGALVAAFMLLYYRKSGFIADVALFINVLLVLALLAAFGATLTLPGIAGILLTVGMAVDANIIIFERIREELRIGRTARSAVDAGFDNALSAVLDANITTGIAGIVLYSYGTGPIKGFAVTLLIGIVTTLYTAIFVSRTFMDLLVRRSTARLAI